MKRRQLILYALWPGRAITSAALARDFGVSLRTIYRDIVAIRANGHRIDGAPGYGYMLRPKREVRA
jgi:predicted DNA-binding transcriptional regulator YafY